MHSTPPRSTLFPYTTLFRSIPHQRKALIQVHCHEHALANPEAERTVLQQLGVDAEIMPNGCCGMAGSFGFGVGKRRSEEHTSELQSRGHLVCRLLLEKKKKQ